MAFPRRDSFVITCGKAANNLDKDDGRTAPCVVFGDRTSTVARAMAVYRRYKFGGIDCGGMIVDECLRRKATCSISG